MRLILPAALLLTGRVHSEAIVLKNPTTGDIALCHTDSGTTPFPIAQALIDNSATWDFASGYETSGWQRVNAIR